MEYGDVKQCVTVVLAGHWDVIGGTAGCPAVDPRAIGIRTGSRDKVVRRTVLVVCDKPTTRPRVVDTDLVVPVTREISHDKLVSTAPSPVFKPGLGFGYVSLVWQVAHGNIPGTGRSFP